MREEEIKMSNNLYSVLFFTFLFLTVINIPFGMARSSVPRLSRKWGRCIYIPILLSIIARRMAVVSYKFIPLFLVATVFGQLLGERIKRKADAKEG